MLRFTLIVIFLYIGLCSCRNINSAGLNLIKVSEGWRANFYTDAAGVRTIGYGHACLGNACKGIKAPISKAQGEAILRKDLNTFQSCVQRLAPGLNDNQFAAVVSFSFNLGCGSLHKSQLLKKLKAKRTKEASKEFAKWVYAGGKKLPGLVTRRKAERDLFCKSGGC